MRILLYRADSDPGDDIIIRFALPKRDLATTEGLSDDTSAR